MLKQIILSTVAAVALGTAVSTANAAGCPIWMCGDNGTQLTGIALGSASGTVSTVILPSGEILDLR